MASNYGKIDYGESPSTKNSRKRLIIIAASSLLLVAATIGVGVGVGVSNDEKSGDSPNPSEFATGSKAIAAACNTTTYPDVCNEELGSNPQAPSANPRQLVSIALKITLARFVESYYLATNLSTQGGSLTESFAIQDCVELMDDAQDYLGQAMAAVSALNLPELSSQLYDALVWLSTASSYRDACANGFDDVPPSEGGRRSEAMRKDQEALSKVVVVAMGLVNSLSDLGADLSSWKASIPNIHFRRRRRMLLSTTDQNGNDDQEGDMEGFPEWVSGVDRRLLSDQPEKVVPDAVVSKDGSGKYKSIQEAIQNIPGNRNKRWVIYIKAGIYNEIISLNKEHRDVTFLGDGIGKTVITGNRNVKLQGYTTFNSATAAITGQGFIAKGVTFRNTAGPEGHQAVALRVGADYTIFFQCSFEGYQDTLYAHASRQFYRDCDIYGTVDYIFGNAIAVFQNCRLLARKGMERQKNTYTAHGRTDRNDPSGYSFQGCSVVPAPDLAASTAVTYTYYGRPWRAYSRTVFINCFIDKHLHPDGWLPWDPSNPFIDTLYYGEHKNRGPGSSIAGRVKWGGVHSAMTPSEANRFSIASFLGPVSWIKNSGVPSS